MFRALSNPNRLKIFIRLASCCHDKKTACDVNELGACVGELGGDLKIAPSTVSHHIKELNRAGLINLERSGRSIRCWLDAEILKELAGFFERRPALQKLE